MTRPHVGGMLRICSFLVLMLAGTAAMADLRGAARVVDGDTLEVSGETVRLYGIDAPERAQTCAGPDGDWPCGRWARRRLQALVAGGVSCDDRGSDRYGRVLSVCHGLADGVDINADMVVAGAAVAFRRYALDYVGAEAVAQHAGAGLWVLGMSSVERPDQFRAAQRQGDAQWQAQPVSGCTIKGNISANGRIYHLPGQRDYERTRIDTTLGERWFCSEPEAMAAGWRAAQR